MARQPKPGPTFMEQYAMAQAFMKFPALTLMVFLRRDLGYRLLNPLVLIAVFGVLAVIAILAMPGNEAARPVDLLIFTGLGFFSGLAQRIRRWREMERNVRQHSYYIGTSPFDQHWMPAFFRRHRRTARIIDPLVCAAIGLALLPFSRALALWLIFSAFCLRAYEDGIFNRERNQELDMTDGLIESNLQGEHVERYAEPSTHGQNPPAEPSVPTGLGDDIQAHVKRRQKK
jgi:hypothetical protein